MQDASAPLVVIVDVLSFSTAVDAACSAGATVFPFRWRDDRVHAFAQSVNARVAVQRQDASPGSPSLSPPSLTALPPGTRLVLPSPNGSTLAAASDASITIAGCLRNARAVANHLNDQAGDVLVIASGERWPDGTLRPALEDWLGAGAIASLLNGQLTDEARAAQAAFDVNADRLLRTLHNLASGKYLCDRGFHADVDFAGQFDVSSTVPELIDGAFVRQ